MAVKLKGKYFQTRISKTEAYILPSCLDKLRECDAIIFDCDGVLIDVRESYIKTIIEVVKFFMKELTGIVVPIEGKIKEIVYLFKRSGGFNNEWDIAYSILAFAFHKFPIKYQQEFTNLVNSAELNEMRNLFLYVKSGLHTQKSKLESNLWSEIEQGLLEFAQSRDSTGILSVEEDLKININGTGEIDQESTALKRFLNYPGNVDESLLTTAYEEFFCGPSLFEAVYLVKPRFYEGKGFIEEEKIIPTIITLDEIGLIFNRDNLGMATGRGYSLTKYTLNKMLERFNSRACVFSDNVEDYERKCANVESKINLKKPHPFSLLKAVEGLNSFKYAMYVGDSMEDVMMAKRANEISPRFISVGVISASDFKEELISDFLKAEVDVILSSVNELPYLMSEVWETKL